MGEEDSGVMGTAGMIVIFSFVSIIFIFVAMLLIGSFNNYALNDLLGITNTFVGNGIIPSDFGTIANETAETFIKIIPYIDYIWFFSFISLIISSLVFSYYRKRENYFNLFTMSVIGIIIFTYVGGIFIQMTEWFRTEILLGVFPTLSQVMPLFTWYLDNLGIINLVLIILNVVANYVDLDFSSFDKRKEGEEIDEI